MSEADSGLAAVDELLRALSEFVFCEMIETQDLIIIPAAGMSLFACAAGDSRAGMAATAISPAGAVIIHRGIAGPDGVQFAPLLPEIAEEHADIAMEKAVERIFRSGL